MADAADDSVETKYKQVVWLVKNGEKSEKSMSNETKLKMYGAYKQVTKGNVEGAQPYRVQMEARAKWDAWNEYKDKTKEEAMQAYVDVVLGFDPELLTRDNHAELLKNMDD